MIEVPVRVDEMFDRARVHFSQSVGDPGARGCITRTITSFPSVPLRTAMFPPEPISAFTLPRRVWTVMSVVSARLRAASTMF